MRDALKSKIKPLWIVLSTRWGGPEQVAMSDMVDLVSADIPITLLCFEGSPVHAAAIRHPRLRVYAIPSHKPSRFDWGFVRALRGKIEEVDANIVHINDERLLWHLRFALARRADISIIANRHTLAERHYFYD